MVAPFNEDPRMAAQPKEPLTRERSGAVALRAEPALLAAAGRVATSPSLGWRDAAIAQLRNFGRFLRGNIGLGPELRQAQAEVMLARTQVLIWISVFVMPTCILGYVYFARPERLTLATEIVGAAVAAVLILLGIVRAGAFRGREQLAMLVLVGGVFGPTGAAIIEISRTQAGDFFFSFFLIYFAFTSLFPADVKWILFTSLLLIASHIGAHIIANGRFAVDGTVARNLNYLLELTFIGVVLNRVLCRLFFDERRAQLELRGARDALFAEMEVAQEIQTLLLPKEHELDGNIVSGLMVPASEVGGDYYDVIVSDSGRTFIAIGDVSGHGVTSGLTMMMARASLLGALAADPNAPLEALYRILNRCLRQNLERMELNLYMTFALFEYVGPGQFDGVGRHLPALIYRKDKRDVDEIDLDGMWLGVLPDLPPKLLPRVRITLAAGDVLFLYTDGIVEHEGERGMFGFDRLKDTLRRSAHEDARTVISTVMKELTTHGKTQDDDVTMLVVKYTGKPMSSRAVA
jgi:serine phosphatase RsbU (regulator of sigma subunit)